MQLNYHDGYVSEQKSHTHKYTQQNLLFEIYLSIVFFICENL